MNFNITNGRFNIPNIICIFFKYIIEEEIIIYI